MKLAVIPARGGSKRIPRKNIKLFLGKPMIAWTIEAARASACFDRLIVSTDDDEIADLARSYGAEVPFRRPDELANDHTGTLPVMAHAIEWMTQHEASPKYVCCIYPTAALLRTAYLQQGMQAILSEDIDYAMSVTSYAFPIQRALKLDASGHIQMLKPEFVNTRSQDLEVRYHDAAQFYWGKADNWLAQKLILTARTKPIVLPHYLAQDIDTVEDWIHAELKFAHHLRPTHNVSGKE